MWTRNALALEQTRVAFAAAEPVITLTSKNNVWFQSMEAMEISSDAGLPPAPKLSTYIYQIRWSSVH